MIKKFWFHAKNFEALDKLKILKKANFFGIKMMTIQLLTRVFWTYPGKNLLKKSICVLPEQYTKQKKFNGILGICSDNISTYKKNNN